MRFDLYRVLDSALTSLGVGYIGTITNEDEVSGYNNSILLETVMEKTFKHDMPSREGLVFINAYGGSEQEVDRLLEEANTLLEGQEFADAKIRLFHIEHSSTSRIIWDTETSKFLGYVAFVMRWEVL